MIRQIIDRLSKATGYRLFRTSFVENKDQSLKALQRNVLSCRKAQNNASRLIRFLQNTCTERLEVFQYGFAAGRRGNSTSMALYPTHDAGLFSCLATVIWTLSELQSRGLTCVTIDNKFGMDNFKSTPRSNEWGKLFRQPSATEVDRYRQTAQRHVGYFDQHGNYEKLVYVDRGVDWFSAVLDCYLSPVDEVSDRVKTWVNRYEISEKTTIAVCYRGTDKRLEIEPTPLSVYFHRVDAQLEAISDGKVLIQTDQEQVRIAFKERYGRRCSFIVDLPVTNGNVVLHQTSVCGDRGEFARNLYAMSLAVAYSKTLITHTGNVGLFLSLHMLLQQKQVIQLR